MYTARSRYLPVQPAVVPYPRPPLGFVYYPLGQQLSAAEITDNRGHRTLTDAELEGAVTYARSQADMLIRCPDWVAPSNGGAIWRGKDGRYYFEATNDAGKKVGPPVLLNGNVTCGPTPIVGTPGAFTGGPRHQDYCAPINWPLPFNEEVRRTWSYGGWKGLGQVSQPALAGYYPLGQQPTITQLPSTAQPPAEINATTRRMMPQYQPPPSQVTVPPTTPYETPPPPGPTHNPQLDTLISKVTTSPMGKAAIIGLFTATMARSFPGKFWAAFFGGAALSVMTGIVPDTKFGEQL